MDITALLRKPLIILALLIAVTACGSSKPKPPSPEEQKRQEEQSELQRLRDLEKARVAQEEGFRKIEAEKRQNEERRKQETALPAEFGKPAPPPPPPAAAPLIAGTPTIGTEQPAVPYDQAFPPIPDRLLRVAVVSAPSQANVAERIGVMLTETERDNLERSLGMGLRVAYLSQSDRDPNRQTRIQYREKYMQAAVRLASVIPEAQRVERMSDDEASRTGVDVLIRVGSDLH
jgi:hypothetical protein